MRRISALGALLFGLVGPVVASAAPVEGLAWTWEPDTTRRWFIEAEIVLPDRALLVTEKSKEARLIAFQTETVITCGHAVPLGRNQVQLACTLDDVSIRGAVMPGDSSESAAIILAAMDETLTGSTLQVRMRHDGRVVNVDLEGVTKRDDRRASMHENLRVLLIRSIAGFDLQLPRKGATAEGVWGQYQSLLMEGAATSGTAGSSEIAHLIRSVDSDYVIIESAGRGLVSPEGDNNYFSSTLESVAVFDVAERMLRERVWSFRGVPTASSATADAGVGVPYIQKGRILYLPDGVDAPTLHDSAEVEPPGVSRDSAIMDWITVGSRG